jgi:hypothetical protein
VWFHYISKKCVLKKLQSHPIKCRRSPHRPPSPTHYPLPKVNGKKISALNSTPYMGSGSLLHTLHTFPQLLEYTLHVWIWLFLSFPLYSVAQQGSPPIEDYTFQTWKSAECMCTAPITNRTIAHTCTGKQHLCPCKQQGTVLAIHCECRSHDSCLSETGLVCQPSLQTLAHSLSRTPYQAEHL